MGNMRKTRITLAAFMACSLCHFAHPVHATMERDGATWWSVEELIEVYEEAKAERRAICGEPPSSCFAEQYFRMVEEVPKYKALERILSWQLSVTSINPAEGLIKVFYYHNTHSSLIKGIEDDKVIEYYFMGWNDYGNQIIRWDSDIPVSDGIPGNHIVYQGNSLTEGENWIPNLKETTLHVDSATLMENTSGALSVEVLGGFVASGTINYSKCLNSSEYKEGMECKLYVSNSGVKKYFPVSNLTNTRSITKETSPEETTNPDEDEINPETGTENRSEVLENSDPETESQSELSGSLEIKAKNQPKSPIDPEPKIISQVNIIPKAPETGENSSPAKYSQELVAWFVMLMIFGVLLVIWWFVPTRAEKSRKKYKKCKKSIDKTRDLR